MSAELTICVFTKAFEVGRVKTRLIPPFGADAATALAMAMYGDVRATVDRVRGARTIVASTGPVARVLGVGDADTWLQGDGDLGARMERVLCRALESSTCVIGVGSDCVGLRPYHIQRAKALLAQADAVLGPSEDGGFHLVGLRRCPVGLFEGIGWSTSHTLEETVARLHALGLTTAFADPLFDVDVEADVRRVQRLVAAGRLWAPRTAAVLAGLPS